MWNRIKNELHPSYLLKKGNLMPAIISGILVGLMTSILSISFAVLVFGKAIPEALSIGIGMALFSNVILHLFSAFASSGEGVVAHVQSLPPPIQAAMVSSLVTTLPLSMSIEQKTFVVILVVLFSAVFTGVVLFLMGWLKWGRLVRFLPLPVISGFLASVGFALILGGMTTLTLKPITVSSLPDLVNISLIVKWLSGVLLAVALWLIVPRWRHPLALPIILGVAIILFYIVHFVQGYSQTDLIRDSLLLGPFPSGSLWHPPQYIYNQINTLDWTMIGNQMGIIATIPLVSFIGGLLMVSAIEFSTEREMNPNFELKIMGVSNFMSGIMGGGFVGYPSTTFTVMQRSLGSDTRLAGILSALIPLVILVAGASFLSFIPRFVVGGLLIYFGYQFVDHWIVKQIKQSTLSQLYIMGVIVVTSLWLGFVTSIGVGILVAIGFFLFKYSQTSIIRYVSTGATLRSRVTRNALHDDWLSVHADRIAIYGLQGFIFFGTANSLPEEIMKRVMDTEQPSLDSVILDFRHVTGIDTSVIQSFHKLYLQLQKRNIALIFAQLPPKYHKLIQKLGFDMASTKGTIHFDNLDEALEVRENNLLNTSDLPKYQTRSIQTVFAEHFKDAAKAALLLRYLQRLDLQPNDKIIEQNTAANDLFFIESGRLSTYLEQKGHSPIRLQTMESDTIVGEIGFYLGTLRTATVIAEAPSIVYRLTKEALTQLEIEQPDVALALHKLLVQKTAKRINHVSNSLKGFL